MSGHVSVVMAGLGSDLEATPGRFHCPIPVAVIRACPRPNANRRRDLRGHEGLVVPRRFFPHPGGAGCGETRTTCCMSPLFRGVIGSILIAPCLGALAWLRWVGSLALFPCAGLVRTLLSFWLRLQRAG